MLNQQVWSNALFRCQVHSFQLDDCHCKALSGRTPQFQPHALAREATKETPFKADAAAQHALMCADQPQTESPQRGRAQAQAHPHLQRQCRLFRQPPAGVSERFRKPYILYKPASVRSECTDSHAKTIKDAGLLKTLQVTAYTRLYNGFQADPGVPPGRDARDGQ